MEASIPTLYKDDTVVEEIVGALRFVCSSLRFNECLEMLFPPSCVVVVVTDDCSVK
jgi:hypothetical protein